MNKKQKNRKIVAQNKRNKMINRRYTSTIKTLLKLFRLKVKEISSKLFNEDEKSQKTKEIKFILQNLSSILDKAVKKGVLHKNNASRKKQNLQKLIKKFQFKKE